MAKKKQAKKRNRAAQDMTLINARHLVREIKRVERMVVKLALSHAKVAAAVALAIGDLRSDVRKLAGRR